MTDPAEAQKQYLDAVREGQRAMVEAVGAWAKSLEQLSAAYPPVAKLPDAPTPDEVVDNAFDFAAQLLATQREFTHQLLAAAAAKPERGAAEEAARQESARPTSDA